MLFDDWTLIVKAVNSNNQREVVLMFNLIDGIIDPTGINAGGVDNDDIHYIPLNWLPMEIHQIWETEDSYRQANEALDRNRAYDRSSYQLIIEAVIEQIVNSGGIFHREGKAAVIEALWNALDEQLSLWDPRDN